MRTAVAWAAGLAVSALAHAVAAVILVPAYAPQDPQAQAPPETRLDMETVEAPRQDAAARDPEGETAAEGEAQATSVGAGAVPQSDARPVTAAAQRQEASPPNATRAEPADPAATALAAATPDAGRIAAADPGAQALAPATPTTATATEAAATEAQTVPPAEVDTASLGAAQPEGVTAQPADPAAERLAAADTGGETARPAAPDAEALAEAVPPAGTALDATRPDPDRLAAAAPEAETSRPATPQAASLAAARPDAAAATASTPAAAPAASIIPATAAAPTLAPDATATAALAPPVASAAPVTATPAALPATQAAGQQTAALAATGTPLPQSPADATPAEEAQPPATSAKAALAWQFGDRVVTDPQALATIQAFMEPAALDDAQGVKDDLSSVLTGVDCARLSATFIPETGRLEMRGHIPDPELRGPILAALQRQVGDGIPVTANLLHLPAPQCGALTGISNVGLPQSTDQFTNARLVGETAHAREYNYTEGQRLQFDLTAPDYDAFVYVDYFNAEGEVIHLVPNDTIELERHDAKSVFGVGKDRPGRPGLRITIGPPYGQEIAVAFAASHRLYDGLRPIVEPAGPYLEELQAMVAEARAEHEDFKGEWVYFFITTAPATQ